MIWLKLVFLLVFCILGSLQGEGLEDVDTHLTSSILKYLDEQNSNYLYRAGRVLQKTDKGVKLEVTFQVEATCDFPCLGGTLKCESIFHKLEGETLWHIAGAICDPIEPVYVGEQKNIPTYVEKSETEQEKMVEVPPMVPRVVGEPKIAPDFVGQPKIASDFNEQPKIATDFVEEPKIVHDIMEEPHTVDVVTPKNTDEFQLKHIEISDESPKESVTCLGCEMDINPNAYGVTDLINTALRHIESERSQKHTALKVLRVQQQVVYGIKYTLLVEVAPTVCPKTVDSPLCPIDQSQNSFICEVQFWEKPREEFNQIINNNCTNTQEYVFNSGFGTTTKLPNREVDFGELESQILSDIEIEQPRTNFIRPDWVNGINPVYSSIDYGAEVILQKRRVSRYSDSDSSSSSSESDESNDKKRHNDDSDDDNKSSDNSDNHKHKHDSSDSSEHHHKHKHNHRHSSESDDREPVKNKHHSDSDESNESSKSSKLCKSIESSESSDSSESDDHKKKHKHHNDSRRKRSVQPEDNPQILDDLAWIASKILDYHNYVLVGSTKVRLNGLHYKLQLLLEKDLTVIECSVFMTVNEGNIYESTINKYHCNTDEVWKNKATHVRRSKTLGGTESISIDDPQVNLFLKDGLTNLDTTSPHTNKYKILKIIEATKQTVSGSLYRIKAYVTVSDCEKVKDTDPAICGVLKDAPVKICNFKIWDQPWLPKGRQTNVTCENDEKEYHFRQRRGILAGGINRIPKDDPQVKLYLKDGLTNMDQVSSHTHKYKVLEVLEASSQVVSGSLHRIKARITVSDCEKGNNVDSDNCGVLKDAPVKVCNFKVLDQPWLPQGRQTNVTCENDEKEYHFRQRRDTLTGSINQIPNDDPRVKLYLNDALTKMDETSSQAQKFKVVEVLNASSQLLNSLLYRIDARITVSDCEKGSKVDIDTCGVLKDAIVQVCNFKIWDSQQHDAKEIFVTCKKDEAYRSKQRRSTGNSGIPGGTNLISTDDPQVEVYLKDALIHLDKSSSHDNKYKVLDVIEASRQIVSGTIYRIKAHIAVSDCEKGKDTNPATCGVLKDAPVKECHFKIWDQPWLPQGRQTNITCDEEQHSFRQRRSVNIPPNEDAINLFFKHFQHKYSKTYTTKAEYKHRLSIFKKNLNMIDLLNKYEQGTARYGINQFSDLTQKEFSSLHGLRMDLKSENDLPFPEAEIPDIDLPTSFDWREKNAVTEVKDQGLCGSCWAFSTTGNVEGQYAIKYKNLTSLSEQELVDCDKMDQGCNGGLMDNAYRAIEKLGGLETEKEYPYDARDEKCHFNTSEVVAKVTSAVNISHDETDMAKWLTQNGPIAIAINANAMQFYMGGVSHPFKIFCNPKDLDHGVLIVGYGVHNYPLFNKTLPYWIVKNSWGTSWGEQGYYRVYRGDGTCGLNQTPSSAIIA